MPFGYYRLYNFNNTLLFEGEVNNNQSSYGIEYYIYGKYEGEFKNGNKEGYGIFFYIIKLNILESIKIM